MKKSIVAIIIATLVLTLAGCASETKTEPTDIEQMQNIEINDIKEYKSEIPYVGNWRAVSIIAANGTESVPDPNAGDYTIQINDDFTSLSMLGAHEYIGTWEMLDSEDLPEELSDEPFPGIQLTDDDGTVIFTYMQEPEAMALFDPNLGSTVIFEKYEVN